MSVTLVFEDGPLRGEKRTVSMVIGPEYHVPMMEYQPPRMLSESDPVSTTILTGVYTVVRSDRIDTPFETVYLRWAGIKTPRHTCPKPRNTPETTVVVNDMEITIKQKST